MLYNRYPNWLEMDKPVLDPSQDLPKGSEPIKLQFAFKYVILAVCACNVLIFVGRYFVDTYQDLQDYMTVELLYVQARKSIEKSEVITDEQTIYELSALVMQANYGRFTTYVYSLNILY